MLLLAYPRCLPKASGTVRTAQEQTTVSLRSVIQFSSGGELYRDRWCYILRASFAFSIATSGQSYGKDVESCSYYMRLALRLKNHSKTEFARALVEARTNASPNFSYGPGSAVKMNMSASDLTRVKRGSLKSSDVHQYSTLQQIQYPL